MAPDEWWKASLWKVFEHIVAAAGSKVTEYLGKVVIAVVLAMAPGEGFETRTAAIQAWSQVVSQAGTSTRPYVSLVAPSLLDLMDIPDTEIALITIGENESLEELINAAHSSLLTLARAVGPSHFAPFLPKAVELTIRNSWFFPRNCSRALCRLFKIHDCAAITNAFSGDEAVALLSKVMPLIVSNAMWIREGQYTSWVFPRLALSLEISDPRGSLVEDFGEDFDLFDGVECDLGAAACLVLLATLMEAFPADVVRPYVHGLTEAIVPHLQDGNQFLVDIAGLSVLALYATARSTVSCYLPAAFISN